MTKPHPHSAERGKGPPALPRSDQELAELRRQGAKAAARGDSAKVNPMNRPQNRPAATGESEEVWADRSDAWQEGHKTQRRSDRAPAADSKSGPEQQESD
jgi:hypothetical protein